MDPSSKQLFHKRKDELLNKLKLLHLEFSSKFKDFTNPKVVTFHGAFGYLFKRYEIQLAGVVELFPGDEPSVSYLKKLVNLMRKLKINVIFAEPQLPDQPAIVIAKKKLMAVSKSLTHVKPSYLNLRIRHTYEGK